MEPHRASALWPHYYQLGCPAPALFQVHAGNDARHGEQDGSPGQTFSTQGPVLQRHQGNQSRDGTPVHRTAPRLSWMELYHQAATVEPIKIPECGIILLKDVEMLVYYNSSTLAKRPA
jgi:hypothetical protein